MVYTSGSDSQGVKIERIANNCFNMFAIYFQHWLLHAIYDSWSSSVPVIGAGDDSVPQNCSTSAVVRFLGGRQQLEPLRSTKVADLT